jgi:hypothetical protein
MNKRQRKISEELLTSEILEALQQTTEADATESEMTRINPPPLVMQLAVKSAVAVVMTWDIARGIISDLQEEG